MRLKTVCQVALLIAWTISAAQMADAAPSLTQTEPGVKGPEADRTVQVATPQIMERLRQILPDALHKATSIAFYERMPDRHWNALPSVILSEHSHPHVFHLMKKTIVSEGPDIRGFPKTKAVFYVNSKAVEEVPYYSDRGWLTVTSGQHGTVPGEVQSWLKDFASNKFFPFPIP